jgi:malate dehydrogenase (oxaloacetate-decarboxylating)(NADP+)
VAPAVAEAAMRSGVATRPLADIEAYRESLSQFVYHSGIIMKPLFAKAKQSPKRIVYAEGEEERVLRAVQVVVDEGLARPVLIGRPAVLERRLARLGLRIQPGVDFDLINPESDPRYSDYWRTYHQLAERKGVSPEYAKIERRSRWFVVRHLWHARATFDVCRSSDWAQSGRQLLCRNECTDVAGPYGVYY